MSKKKNKNNVVLVMFLRILLVVVIFAIIVLFFIIAMAVFNKVTGKPSLDEQVASTKATTEEITTEEDIDLEDYVIASNGDAAEEVVIPGWLQGKTLYDPQMTDDTIHLPSADMSVFNQVIEDEEGNDASSDEDASGGSAWDAVSLQLSSVDGSINYSSPGDAVKTEQLTSTYMILVDLDENTIVAERDCDKVVSPASMTKILTVLTARDFIEPENLDDTFEITTEITDYVRKNDCSAVGFLPGDQVTVRDLLYGTVLPSGGDAAIGLAEYCCGDVDTFVECMNQKVADLGLSDTAHFTNVVGIYNPDLHCTMKDMSVILATAIQDDLLLDVLSARQYTTSTTYEELDLPDGITVSNWFLRKIEDKEMNGDVIAAKTGFVNEAGCCAASYYEADNGKRYICVTGNSYSSWRTIYDHVSVYRSLTP